MDKNTCRTHLSLYWTHACFLVSRLGRLDVDNQDCNSLLASMSRFSWSSSLWIRSVDVVVVVVVLVVVLVPSTSSSGGGLATLTFSQSRLLSNLRASVNAGLGLGFGGWSSCFTISDWNKIYGFCVHSGVLLRTYYSEYCLLRCKYRNL